MSHTTRRKSAIKSLDGLKKACDRVPGAKYLGHGEARTYSGTHTGHRVQLPGWRYPVTVDTNTGEVTFDNYGGSWGSETELDKLKQAYGVEAAKAQAMEEGREFEEIKLDDGSIKCIIPLGGGGYETDPGAGGGQEGGWGV